jgi:hypothetical protein
VKVSDHAQAFVILIRVDQVPLGSDENVPVAEIKEAILADVGTPVL